MKSNKGFSLVELIVVIAIMAIIAAVAVPVYNTYITKADTAVINQSIDDAIYATKLANIEYTCGATIKVNGTTMTITFGDGETTSTKAAAAQVAKVLNASTPTSNVVTVTLTKSATDSEKSIVISATGVVTSDYRKTNA